MCINPLPALARLAGLLAFPVFLSGCFSLPDSPDSRGVKLSDAMQASANNDRHDLGGSSSYESQPQPGLDLNILGGTASGGESAAVSNDRNEYIWQLLLDTSYALPINSDFEGITHFTLTPLSFEDEENFLGIYVGGAIVDLKSGSLPARAVNDTWMLETGISARHYLNSTKPAFSPYIAASAGYALLFWDYRNPIVAGGDTISSDSLSALEGSIGFGISTRRDKFINLFGEVDLGGTLFWNTTNQGFENDVFHNFGFLSVKAGVSFRF